MGLLISGEWAARNVVWGTRPNFLSPPSCCEGLGLTSYSTYGCTAILDCKADGERKERGKGLENLVASHDRGVPGFSMDFRGVSGFENASSWL